jgi:hypothetical protein
MKLTVETTGLKEQPTLEVLTGWADVMMIY